MVSSTSEAGPSTNPRFQSTIHHGAPTPSRITTQNPVRGDARQHARSPSMTSFSAQRPQAVRMNRPYPLILLAALDLAFTYKHTSDISIRLALLVLTRALVLIWIGLNKRWRTKKGYLMLVTGLSLVNCIWEGCTLVLMRSMRKGGGKDGDAEDQPHDNLTDGRILIMTSILAMAEYFLYLLLLRISPPAQTVSLYKSYNSSSIRLPTASTAQTPSSIRFKSSNTPSSVRFDVHHHRRSLSRGTMRSVRGEASHEYPSENNSQGAVDVFTSGVELGTGQLERRSLDRLDTEYALQTQDGIYELARGQHLDEDTDLEDDDDQSDDFSLSEAEYDDGFHEGLSDDVRRNVYIDEEAGPSEYEDDDDDDSSSVSSSSIIDLPPPQSPSLIPLPLTLPRSTSLNLNSLNVGRVGEQLGSSPIVGPIIRKTKSSKLLRGSWNNTNKWLNGQIRSDTSTGPKQSVATSQSIEDSYGTFR
ncbi:uncharacterized protein I303_104473 [Kwoniella dejecticola CBS 10117]|uniref:DUF1746 domain-containing protein n=1 Tax=Kwoniella dejecticola CBS 10117 TaxID=1296121 RepID=A0A1A6A592_9TREE|nr:uncharacterized protein I303_04549 [Kwoniella dejecticola CBS 10117]OBR85216.1 hypothetical protein I303_04549 [Kwoniella dejecticola CBS 10117]